MDLKKIYNSSISNNNKIKLINSIIKDEIIKKQNEFIGKSIKRKNEINSLIKNKKIGIFDPMIKDSKLSEQYYNDIKNIFSYLISVFICGEIKKNYKEDEECNKTKIKYYTNLIELLNLYDLTNGKNGFKNVREYLYYEYVLVVKNKTDNFINEIYVKKINDLQRELIRSLKEKIETLESKKILKKNNKNKTIK
jgi:hypothetical protein